MVYIIGPPPELQQTLELEIRSLRAERNALQKECDTLKNKLNVCQAGKAHLLSLLHKHFTQGQVKLLISNKSKVRWSFEDISSAISLHTVSPKAYRYLKNVKKIPLPEFSTLRKWAGGINVEPGMLNDVVSIMKHRAKDLKHLDKLCILSFDEAYIPNNVTNEQEDQTNPYQTVQVVMIWSLYSKWKQVVYYNYDQKITKDILLDIITRVYEVNYTVVGVISNLESANWALWKDFSVGIELDENCCFKHPVNNKINVYVFFDAQHLLKSIRDNLFDVGFVFNNKIIDKRCFEKLIELQSGDVKLAPELTKFHLDVSGAQRQKVKYAVQCFSHTVSQAITWCAQQDIMDDLQCDEVAEMIELISSWFDIFNAKNKFNVRIPTIGLQFESQFEIIDKTNTFISHVRVGQNKDLLPFQKGIILSNSSLVHLYNDLKSKYNIDHLLPYRLNQDMLDHFFTYLRTMGALGDPPTSVSFKHCLRWYVLGKHSSPVLGENRIKRLNKKSPTGIVTKRKRKQQKIMNKEA